MGSVSVKVDISQQSLEHAVGFAEGTAQALRSMTDGITGSANALSSGFRTGIYYVDHKAPHVGGTQPEYAGSVRLGRKGYVGIVHPANYAAMKDNYMNNTLLKAKG